MVSIQGFAHPILHSKNAKLKKSEKSSALVETANSSGIHETAQPSAIAKAVAQGIRSSDFAQEAYQQIQYDVPDGKSRQALASYLAVKHQAKRDALMALFGVDIFI